MNTKKTGKESGFTIIEVVLVLAIAALIFLIVFLAVPALQRGQRDTQRRNDVSRMVAQLQSYQSNNKGGVPDSNAKLQSFVDNYLKTGGDNFADPREDAYTVVYGTIADANGLTKDQIGRIVYVKGAKCDGETVTTTGAGARSVAVKTPLEGAGFNCTSN